MHSKFWTSEDGNVCAQVIPGDLFLVVWSSDREDEADKYALEVATDGDVGWWQLESDASAASAEVDEVWSDKAFCAFARAWAEELELGARGEATWDSVAWRPTRKEDA
jgi:hypothetical protein